MRSILLLTALLSVAAQAKSHAPASQLSRPSDIKISTEFEYRDALRNTSSTTSAVFDRASHDWKTIFTHSNGVQLQARVISSSQKDVRVEYQALDTKNNNEILASPAMIALFGEKASIESSKNGAQTKISLLANPVK